MKKENVKKSVKNRKKKNKKKNAVFTAVGCLAILAAATVSAAIVTAKAQSKDNHAVETYDQTETADQVEVQAESVQYFIDENQYRIELDELQEKIEDTIENTKQITGGEWSVYISIPSTGDTLSMNPKKMHAASVIKLFIMGAVYDDYDNLKQKYKNDNIDELIEEMITVSDNESADILVTMLGKGDESKGKKAVNDYCKNLGLENTVMGRMIQENDDINDNYTTTEDTAKFLEMILGGELKHSKEMMEYLKNQTRIIKIPAGIPTSVTIANKTGELEDVQNDVAIVFAKRPYIICVMADGVLDYQTPIDGIVEISHKTYNYLVTKM